MRALDILLSQPAQRLLCKVLLNAGQDFGTVELLSLMGSSRGAGSALLKRCVDGGLLRERKVGNQRRLSANPEFLLYADLRSMLVKTLALADPLARALAPFADRIAEAFVFGSVAEGRDTSDSDIDLAVVGNVSLFDLSPKLDAVQSELGRPVHVNLYSSAEWASDDAVLAAIKQGPRIDLMEAIHAETR
ncbi:nucleotidyltransferase domain-containing protein [Roseateles sp.]|uniref:nucleotidyltransferase domain-containing protein n=1 Tax=Roseateles sp. TaxID=1971397 RepID=UPI00326520CE